ncbi:MAG: hypothetical protein V4773_28645, partial [Verrucomicrobiota bacterium]
TIRPPAAFIPQRNGSDSFASNNPSPGQPAPAPLDPTVGRQNTQGLRAFRFRPMAGRCLPCCNRPRARMAAPVAPASYGSTRDCSPTI